MTAKSALIHAIEQQAWIDQVADPLQAGVRATLERSPLVADVLHGRFLGHPLHAALVSVPVGAFTIALVLDAAEVTTGTRRYRRAADLVTGIGLGGAVVASVAGLADWSLTQGPTKRVGFVHAVLNQLIAGTYGISLYARARRHRGAGIALAATGWSALVFSAWLGGELAYRFGVGVSWRPEAPPPPTPDVRPAEHVGVSAGG
jgi:uncharacterized membrane protein